MTTTIFAHPDCQLHDPTAGHPEQPARYAAVEIALKAPRFEHLLWEEAPLGTWGDVALGHPEVYQKFIQQAEQCRAQNPEGLSALDPDTSIGPHSLDAALRGVGAGVAAVDAVMSGKTDNAFCLVRPPGHHAEPEKAMGFCVFNNAVIAAYHARKHHGLTRVAVVDFDVHHGNGTQAAFWDDEAAFLASSHEWPQYPGSGLETETGRFNTIYNQRLQGGAGSTEFQRAWGEKLLPALNNFAPDMIIISAGFDGHGADPLGGLNLQETDFAWITEQLCQIAQDNCNGRVVSLLEGGYDLPALGKSAAAHVNSLASAR